MFNIKHIILAASMLAFAGTAFAVPIKGKVEITGSASIATDSFLTSDTIFITNNLVVDATEDYAANGIGFGTAVDHDDIVYSGGTLPFTELWFIDIGGGDYFAFDLETLNVNQLTADFIDLSGTGTVYTTLVDLEATAGDWDLSAQKGSGEMTFSWSSSTIKAPAPGITLLLGMGLIGFAAARKLRA